MQTKIAKTVASANISNAMGAETIQKARVCLKNHKSKKKIIIQAFAAIIVSLLFTSCFSSRVIISYSATFVPEEGGINFVKITTDADAVVSPGFNSNNKTYITSAPSKTGVFWYIYPVLAVSPDGEKIGYISNRNDVTNVMVKSATQGGGSVQQTFRSNVKNFTFSPDGAKICYTEYRDEHDGIFMMEFAKGTVTQKISPTGSNDNCPSMSKQGRTIFFDRYEGNYNWGLWSYNAENGLFSNYSHGVAPCVDPTNDKIIYCARYTTDDKVSINTQFYGNLLSGQKIIYKTYDKSRRYEIWKLDTEKGTEELLLSDKMSSFSCPRVSPDGKWILMTGANKSNNGIWNTNIFVMRADGTNFTQLTFHPGNDMSAIWSSDGKDIYFVSQRGTEKGIYNVWKMNFPLYNK